MPESDLRLHDLPCVLSPAEYRVLLTRVSAGFPSPADGEEDDPIDLASWLIAKPAATYLMRVEGQSMSGAGITDGDLVAVSRDEQPHAHDIVVAIVHGERTLKRLRRKEGRFWLVPEAEGYPHIIVDEFVEIWGVVVGLVRRYRR